MVLQKMKRRHDGRIFIKTCIVNLVWRGGEYTLCGDAIPDTNLEINDCERVGDFIAGTLKKVNCSE